MTVLLWIIRVLLSFFLGLVVLVAFLAWMAATSLHSLLDYRIYADALEEQDFYERIYSEVFPSVSPDNPIRAALEQVPGVPYEDQVALVQQVAPPDYLQEQTESILKGASLYLTGESNRLDLYLELGGPLDRTGPTLLDYLDRRIDGLEVVEPDNLLEALAQGAFIQELTESLRLLLEERQLPGRVPSIAFIPEFLRPPTFDLVFVRIPELLSLDADASLELENATPELREQFIVGNTLEFLKLATRLIVGSAIEKALVFFESEMDLDDRRRFDLTATAAEGAGYSNVAELQREIDSSWAGAYERFNQARTLLIIVVIAATIIMGLLYLPHITHCLRWPGLVLLLIGALAFILGMAVEANAPDAVADMLQDTLVRDLGSSSPAALLVSETLQSVVEGLLDGIGTPGLWLALVGAVLFAGSFGWSHWQRSRRREATAGVAAVSVPLTTPGANIAPEPGTGSGVDTEPDAGASDTPEPDTGSGVDTEPDAGAGVDTEPAAGSSVAPEPAAGSSVAPEPDAGASDTPEPEANGEYDRG